MTQGGFQHEYMILEYMENGTLGTFLKRVEGWIIPNRMLWRIFLCSKLEQRLVSMKALDL